MKTEPWIGPNCNDAWLALELSDKPGGYFRTRYSNSYSGPCYLGKLVPSLDVYNRN